MRATVLKGLEAVHKRPGMYIGDTTDGSGLHNMIYEVVDNAINEALAGHCDGIDVVLNAGGSVTVRDNGRGIRTEIDKSRGVSTAEVIMTQLHPSPALAQIRAEPPRVLHGVGISVVNALSDVLDLGIWRDGKEYFMRFHMGDPEASLAVVGPAVGSDRKPRRGTEITFLPSVKIFTRGELDFATIEHRLRELASLNAGATIRLVDQRGIEKKELVLRI